MAPPPLCLVLLAAALPLALAGCRQERPAAAPAASRRDAGAVKEIEVQEDPVKTGIEAGDAGLAAKVRSRLAGDPQLRQLRIEVDAEGGRVTLWGHVGRAEDRAAAERLAHRTPGVSAVIDLVKLDGQGRPSS